MHPAVKPKPKIPPVGERNLAARQEVAVFHPAEPGSKDSHGFPIPMRLRVFRHLGSDGQPTGPYQIERRRGRPPMPGEKPVLAETGETTPKNYTVRRLEHGDNFYSVEVTATKHKAGVASAKDLFMNLGPERRGLGTTQLARQRRQRVSRRQRKQAAGGMPSREPAPPKDSGRNKNKSGIVTTNGRTDRWGKRILSDKR